MAKVVFRRAAIDDLNDIWNYTNNRWSEKQADRYYLSLKIACSQIAENPHLGREYDGMMGGLFGLKTGKHIIFYQIRNEEQLDVVRILHERMDLKSKMMR